MVTPDAQTVTFGVDDPRTGVMPRMEWETNGDYDARWIRHVERRAAHAHALRVLADVIETGELPLTNIPAGSDQSWERIRIYCGSAAAMRNAARVLNEHFGDGEKGSENGSPYIRWTLGRDRYVYAYRTDLTCEKVPTGKTETVKKRIVVTPEVTDIEEVEEPIYEYRCPDSLLAD